MIDKTTYFHILSRIFLKIHATHGECTIMVKSAQKVNIKTYLYGVVMAQLVFSVVLLYSARYLTGGLVGVCTLPAWFVTMIFAGAEVYWIQQNITSDDSDDLPWSALLSMSEKGVKIGGIATVLMLLGMTYGVWRSDRAIWTTISDIYMVVPSSFMDRIVDFVSRVWTTAMSNVLIDILPLLASIGCLYGLSYLISACWRFRAWRRLKMSFR